VAYTKPEMLVLGRAIDAVQTNSKGGQVIDAPLSKTAGAYEADE
jgi:hypothetical protein